MENERVIKIIQAGLSWGNWTDEQKEAFIIAGESVKKQIPQKCIKIKGVSSQTCPVYKSNVNGKYCPSCGQRIKY